MNGKNSSSSPKVLFVLKKRDVSWGDNVYGKGFSSGLLNSASFVCNMLKNEGIGSKLVEVVDNNCIDKEVTLFKPTHVIIEAYWVLPEKFEVLTKLNPKVIWIIRNHSEIPFLANEGIAMEWSRRYANYKNVYVSCNNLRCMDSFNTFIPKHKNVYLPNFYPVTGKNSNLDIFFEFLKFRKCSNNPLHIACPGAIRPLKNHLLQAIAALKVGEELNRKMYFHINGSRLEMNGSNILKNLRALFDNNPLGELVEEPWANHEDFKKRLQGMDAVMQVSYSETFNIVGADAVDVGVPLISSSELQWSNKMYQADFNDVNDIAEKLKRAILVPYSASYARRLLKNHVKNVPNIWMDVLLTT